MSERSNILKTIARKALEKAVDKLIKKEACVVEPNSEHLVAVEAIVTVDGVRHELRHGGSVKVGKAFDRTVSSSPKSVELLAFLFSQIDPASAHTLCARAKQKGIATDKVKDAEAIAMAIDLVESLTISEKVPSSPRCTVSLTSLEGILQTVAK